MANGEVYAQVDASVVNGGIAPMAIVSGNPEPVDGQAYVVVWIRWQYDDTTGEGGYTGTGWYFDDPDNNIKITEHYSNEVEFKQWLVANKLLDLDSVLGDWPAENKAAFLNKYHGKLEENNCIYFTAGV